MGRFKVHENLRTVYRAVHFGREHLRAAAGLQPGHPRVPVRLSGSRKLHVRPRVRPFRVHVPGADERNRLRFGDLARQAERGLFVLPVVAPDAVAVQDRLDFLPVAETVHGCIRVERAGTLDPKVKVRRVEPRGVLVLGDERVK